MTNTSNRLPSRFLSMFLLLAGLTSAGCGPNGGSDSQLFEILLRLSVTPEPLGELSFEIDYRGGGDFVGSGTTVACEVVDDAGTTDGDFDDDDVATIGVDLSSDVGIEAGTDLFRCTFLADEQPTTGNFPITILNAVADDGSDVPNNQVAVIVKSITLADGGEDEEEEHLVTLRFTNAVSDVGEISFAVSFAGTGGGGFTANEDDEADCTNLVTGADLTATLEGDVLEIVLEHDDGFDGPTNLVRCIFLAEDAPGADDFDIEDVAAEDVDGDEIASPDVEVSSVATP